MDDDDILEDLSPHFEDEPEAHESESDVDVLVDLSMGSPNRMDAVRGLDLLALRLLSCPLVRLGPSTTCMHVSSWIHFLGTPLP
jgi:hypothetical protein